MKIVITGHTRGIGKGFYEYYSNEINNVTGFSRSNGYDLKNPLVYSEIIKKTYDADIFINNAYVGDAQYQLAKMWFDLNKDRHSLIVNISSIAVEYEPFIDSKISFDLPSDLFSTYLENKKILNQLSWKINSSASLSKALIVSPGVVDTDFASPILRSECKNKGIIININEIVSLATDAISKFNKNTFVPQVLISNNIS
jgi:hypothetical protein